MRRILATAFVVGSFVTAPALAGWNFVQTTQTRGGDANSTTKARVRTEGPNTRIDFLETDNPMMGQGSYMLVRETDKDAAVFLVDPSKKTYMRFDPGEMQSVMSAAQEQLAAQEESGLRTEIKDAKFEKLAEEPGEKILGHPTTHYRYRTRYKQVQKAHAGPDISVEYDVLEDVWLAATIDIGKGAGFLDMVGGEGVGMIDELDKLEAQKASGFALRSVTVETTKMTGMGRMAAMMMGGGKDKTTSTVEVTELREEPLEAALFELPAGYREQQFAMPGSPALPNLDEE